MAVLERWKGFGDVAVASFWNGSVVRCSLSVAQRREVVARMERGFRMTNVQGPMTKE
jgi:hypothetical protein